MAKPANKTQPTRQSPPQYINGIDDPSQRKDSRVLMKMMKEVTGKRGVMWGASIIGFGRYHYRYESGREGEYLVTGFAPRKNNLAIYIMPGFGDFEALLGRLGKYSTGKSCLYVRRLEDIDLDVLRELVSRSVSTMRSRYDCD